MSQLDPVVLDALNRQMTAERYNVVLYKALGYRLTYLNLPGFGTWMHRAASEENTHARKFAEYIIDRGAYPVVAPLEGADAPQGDMTTAPALCFTTALQREITITDQIKILYDLADEVRDSQTCQFLLWFLEEQTRSVREVTELAARAQYAGGCPAAILQMDHELGA